MNMVTPTEAPGGWLPAPFAKFSRRSGSVRHESGFVWGDATVMSALDATLTVVRNRVGDQSCGQTAQMPRTATVGALVSLMASDGADPMAVTVAAARSSVPSIATRDSIGRSLGVQPAGAPTAASVPQGVSTELTGATGASLGHYLRPKPGSGIMWQLVPAKSAQVRPDSERVMKATLSSGKPMKLYSAAQKSMTGVAEDNLSRVVVESSSEPGLTRTAVTKGIAPEPIQIEMPRIACVAAAAAAASIACVG